jgi:hypothetical protein
MIMKAQRISRDPAVIIFVMLAVISVISRVWLVVAPLLYRS